MGLLRFCFLPKSLKGSTFVVVGLGIVGIQADGLVVGGKGFLMPLRFGFLWRKGRWWLLGVRLRGGWRSNSSLFRQLALRLLLDGQPAWIIGHQAQGFFGPLLHLRPLPLLGQGRDGVTEQCQA
jgi:hypothetical protein